MNIVHLKPTAIVIECLSCLTDAETPLSACELLTEALLRVPCSTPGCDRTTFIPRQMTGDDPVDWRWEHNRAMNAAVRNAIAESTPVHSGMPAPVKARLKQEQERGKGKRFNWEEYEVFTPIQRIRSIKDELSELEAELAAAAAKP